MELLSTKEHILFAVLNWGLGHASRMIPIIRQRLESQKPFTIASDGVALDLLKKEFPSQKFIELPGYNISSGRRHFIIQYAAQIPSILSCIKKEKRQVDEWIKNTDCDLIISDNRYGVYHDKVESIMLSHQLNLFPNDFIKGQVLRIAINKLLKNFNHIWIPDDESNTLTGELSKPGGLNIPISYIGVQSRLRKMRVPIDNDILLLLSGVEPQRTILEESLIKTIKSLDLECTLVRGTNKPLGEIDRSIKVFSILDSEAINRLICSSKIVVSRAGYSSIMDYVKLGKKAILIPTPGQQEQLYLAKHLKDKNLFDLLDQKNIPQNLPILIEEKLNIANISS